MLRARGVAQPSLSLTYSSRAGSREAGMGWGLSLPTIERQPLSGWPSFDDGEGHDPAVKDRFAFDGKPLVFLCTVGVSCPQNDPTEAAGATWSFPSWATGAQYFRLQVDGMGARFFFFPGEHRWRVQLRGGTEMQLGYPTTLAGATGPAVDAEANGTKVARYKIARLVDAWGNAAVYRWQNMGARGLSYLTDIFDTSDVGSPGDLDAYAHHVQLDWEPAPAGYTAWTAAHVDRGAMDMRLRRVGVSAAPWSGATAREVVRLYKLEYFDRRTDDGSNIDPSAGPLWNRWFLKSLQTLGKCGGVETDGQITEAYQCWGPLPMTFEYQAPAPVVGGNVIERVNVEGAMQTRSAAAAIDANRDGLPDILRSWSYGAADHREAHLLLRNTSSPVGGTLGFERDCIDGGAPTDLTGLYVREGASADFDADHYKFLGPSGKTLVGSFGDALAMWSAPAPLPQFLPMRLNPTVMAERFCPTVAGWAPKASFKWSFAGVTGWLQPIPDPAVSGTYFVDADGDGLLDEVLPYSVLATGWNNGSVFFSRRLPAGATAAAPYGTAASVRQISFLQEGPMTVMPATRAPEQHGLFKHWYADMDGDGLPELIWASSVNNGGAYTVYPGDGRGSFGCGDPAQPRSPHCAGSQFYTVAGPGISDRNVYFVDVTGDGLADLVVPELGENEGGIRLWINQDGKSFACAQPATACRVAQLGDNCPALPGKTGFNTCLGSNAAYGEGNTSVSFADMNADGVEDMVVIRNDFVWTWSAVRAGGIVPPPASPWAHAPKPGLLTRINDGRGKTVEVKYESAQLLDRAAAGTSSPWSSHLPQATQVVTTIHVANTRHAHGDSSDDLDFKPERWTNYSYRDPAFDPWRQQFVGFRSVSVTTGASMVETQYWHSNCEKDSIVMCIGGTDDDDWRWKSGLPVRIDRRSTAVQQGVRRLSTHFPKWSARVLAQGATASDRRRVWLPFEEDRRTYLYDGASPSTDAGVDSDPNGDSVPKPATQAGIRVELRSTMDVDNHGNTTKRWDFGRTDVADTSLSTISVTCNERNQCLVGSSSLAWPTAPTAAQWVDRSRQYTYGPHGELTTVSTVVDRTSVLDRRHEAGGATAPLPSSATLAGQEVQLAELTYDAYGNVTRRSGPDHIGCASTEYDERYRQLPEVEYTHHVGCGPLALADATGFTWDRGHELPTNVVGPHGDPHVAVYDPFGRLEVFYEPLPETGGLVLAGERFYEDGSEGSPVQRARSIDYLSDAPAQTREVVTIADVLGQPIATYTKYGGLWDVHGYAKYSTEGLPYYSQRPTRTAQDPTTSPTTIGAPRGASADNSFGYLYDDYFRLTTVVDGTVPVASYQRLPLSVSVRDAEQIGGSHTAASTIVDTDGHGRTSRVRQVTAAATITTTRSYLASGEVWKEERTALGTSVARTMVYDSLGRVVENHEPNTEHTDASGTKRFWRYAWDAAGRLVGTSDPRGCGKNVFYDDRSRKTAEDYSPCLASQAPYSPPDLVTGEGAETFYLYDDYEAGQVAPSATFADNAQFAIGRLVAVHDRGAHSRFNYDVRGRVRRTSRRIARPAGAPPGADAYTSHWFVAESEFDNGDRLVSQTTGASAPALMGWGGRSEVSYGYDVAGHLHHVNSSYDGLVAGMQYAPDGQPTDVAYADAASTTATLTYDARRRLTDYALRRPGGSPMWTAAAPPPSYPLPNSQTTQRELTWLHYTRDLVGNPTAIDDLAPQSATTAWPGGAKPVAQRTFAYDDLYRVLTAGYRYMGNALSPNDGQVNPYAKELTEPGSPAPIPRRSVSARVRQQTFAYDHLGNTTSTGDDQSLRFDRSLGAITNGTAHPNQLVSASGVSAKYDPAGNLVDLTVTRPGTCDAGKCAQRFVYEWDEVGQLVRARRWDYTGNTIPAGEPVHPAVPTQAPDRDLRYAYSMGSRVLKTVADETSAQMHTLEVFGSLRVEGAQLLGDDYELNENTEKVYLGGLGRLVYDPTLPSWSGDPKH
ncbi:MAG: VCBS repeat-containing protein, partial [Myxococcales bacterium]|nr:VCBS repeat-containing protein [Myxococcales bacterium]